MVDEMQDASEEADKFRRHVSRPPPPPGQQRSASGSRRRHRPPTATVTAPAAAPGPQAYQPRPPPSQAEGPVQRAHGAMSRPTSAGKGNYGAREKRVTARNTFLLKPGNVHRPTRFLFQSGTASLPRQLHQDFISTSGLGITKQAKKKWNNLRGRYKANVHSCRSRNLGSKPRKQRPDLQILQEDGPPAGFEDPERPLHNVTPSGIVPVVAST
ncbi:unnamed protein product [Boreogadus saida]